MTAPDHRASVDPLLRSVVGRADESVRFLDLGAVHAQVQAEIDEAVLRVARSGWFVMGEEVERFEADWAAASGAAWAVGVNSGLDAMTVGLVALGVGRGDEVLVPANTFIATWLAVSAVGAVPVPVDPDPSTHLISPDACEAAITPRTRAVLPVHLYGRPADVDGFRGLAARHGLRLLFDAAQAHGATSGGIPLGGCGDLTAWSFYPTKNLGALGDGGAVTTDDPLLAARVRRLRNYGSDARNSHPEQGANSRLDEIQAAVLRAKLPNLDPWNRRRRAIAGRYSEGLADLAGLTLPQAVDGHAWHLYVVRSGDRDGLQRRLRIEGVETLVHYPVPPHRQGAYASLAPGFAPLPVAERLAEEVLSLPMGPHLDDETVDRVIAAVRRCT